MKKRVLVLIMLLVLLSVQTTALASDFYIIADSNSRLLTEDELWEWQYDALGYILNEIFARYGMPFDRDGKYFPYFNSQAWYMEDANFTYDSLNATEWANERLVKDVREVMRDTDNYNPSGKLVPAIEPPMDNIPYGFVKYYFKPDQKLSVYSGPGTNYVRGAGGRATASTNGAIYVYGRENGWLLILYRLDNDGGRMGYVQESKIKDSVDTNILDFNYQKTKVLSACSITDDPMISDKALAKLKSGAPVTFLCWMQNSSNWAYVEANTSAGLVRGCIPADVIDLSDDDTLPDS
jgi:hypothetical protein